MKYYRIWFTLNSKFRGSNDYIKNYILKIPNNKLFIDEPKFIGMIHNEKIDFEPYLLDIELYTASILNDLIMDGGPVSKKLITSNKLKSIFKKYRKTGMQFFNINILKNKEIFTDYWLLNMYEFSQEFIDFKRCKIIYCKKDDDFDITFSAKNLEIKVNSLKEFNNYIEKAKERLETITIEKLELINVNQDFFILKYVNGGIGYFVSEKIKQDIEDAGCTGIEFQPIEFSYNEWYGKNGEREKIYGKV